MRLLAAATACMMVAVVGCVGYQVGNRTLYPSQIRTVHVPMFESESFRPGLGEQLTEAVVKEIEAKTPYKVVPGSRADSQLIGRIRGDSKSVLVPDPYRDPRETEVRFQVEIRWLDRQGREIADCSRIEVMPELVVGTGRAVPEAGHSIATAHSQAIRRLAEQIVSMMESPW